MRIATTPIDLQVGDIYQGRRIVYIGGQGEVVYVDFEDGGYKSFQANGQIEVVRNVENVELKG